MTHPTFPLGINPYVVYAGVLGSFLFSLVIFVRTQLQQRQEYLDKNRSILIINPNTTQAMTDALQDPIRALGFGYTDYTFFTAPSGVPSINDEHDAAISTEACLPALEPLLDRYDAFLVCCYSAHPLVPALRELIASRRLEHKEQQHHLIKDSFIKTHESNRKSGTKRRTNGTRSTPPQKKHKARQQPVTGIFEASIASCLQLLSFSSSTDHVKGRSHRSSKFAILTTGPQYEILLNAAVQALLMGDEDNKNISRDDQKPRPSLSSPSSSRMSERFAGTFTTGLNADELHSAPQAEVHRRMKKAAQQALERGARALCLGCAGMVGLEDTVREACVEALGEEEGHKIWIVDGVVSGVAFLQGALRAGV